MSMDKLTYVIGKAPSEMEYNELTSLLVKERERISNLLYAASAKKKKASPKPKTPNTPKKKKKSTSKRISVKDAEKLMKLIGA